MKARSALLLLIPLLLGGCETLEEASLTGQLWSNPEFRNFSQPAATPNLGLTELHDYGDILVEYDAQSEKNPSLRHRAYFLGANQERISDRKKPRFVNPTAVGKVSSIPVESVDAWPTNSLPGPFPRALYVKKEDQFRVFRGDEEPETYELPVYVESNGFAARVALTPLAVAGDTAMVGCVAGMLALIGMAQSGASFFWPK